MNRIGRLFSVQIFGESHGPAVGVVIDGCPPGIYLTEKMFLPDLERRKGGIKRGSTPRQEEDYPIIQSGVFKQKTTGAPITIIFENKNTRSQDYGKQRNTPRPGHADWVANKKYKGFEDYRGGGHFSARLTAGLVAAGVVAKIMIPSIDIQAKIIEIGGKDSVEKGLERAIAANDSVGAIIECVASNVPVGLGEPYFHSLESAIAQIIFSTPAVKGIEFGRGFEAARMFGSTHNDPIENAEGKTTTNHAGGIVGGIINGNDIVFRVAFKPTSSTPQQQTSWNRDSEKMETFAIKGRHDLCVALRAPVIVEAALAITLVDMLLVNGKTD